MKFLLEEMLRPASRRIGTLLGGALLGIGATEQLAGQVEVVNGGAILGHGSGAVVVSRAA
ncbi:hypothetical protein [Tritonibacter mobilis]|uniref:hypothetical protein n=1 Tax=Tritonibacter mobilis TaxID=379347 RepID=UPI001CDA2289|nr:hypothetical protein [Tritonibacter mobilis]MCA2009588.1 hypothetical protein [Tritonibacter mobilis]